MTESKSYNSSSFLSKTRIILVLLGILPFLIVLYLFYYTGFDITGTVVIFSALTLLSILGGFMLLRKSSDRLIDLARKTSIGKDDKGNGPIQITADQELKDIAENFNVVFNKSVGIDREFKEQAVQLMKYAQDLSKSYEKYKKEEKLRNMLSRYVGADLVEKLVDSDKGGFPKDERKEVTVLFADIRSFTTIAESMDAQDVLAMLNEFFGILVDIVFKNNGMLDKFLGDQLMAVFGLIPHENNAAYYAVKTAIEMQDATEALMKIRDKQKKDAFEIGIGINTGNCIVGNVGAEKRMDYTVIGDSVNIAARLQQMAKGGEIIIGEKTYHQFQGRFRAEEKGEIFVKNKTEPVICYNVLRGLRAVRGLN